MDRQDVGLADPPPTAARRGRRPSRALGLASGALIGAAALGVAAPAGAETLADAIALAYQSNPTLQSQRAQLRGLDETYVQTRAAFGPTVTAQAVDAYNKTNLPVSPVLPPGQLGTNTATAQVTVSQPIYNGGRSAAGARGAMARVEAGRAQLRSTEGDVVLSVVGAYSDVLRDEQALAVRRQHLSMLSYQLDMVKAQRGAGELTITDVAQAQAQYATERSLVADAMNQLQIDRAAYATVVGQNPGELAPEPPLPGVPATVDAAFAIAERSNPELQQARDTEEVSRQQVIAAKAAFLPTVAIGGTAAYANATQPYFGSSDVWNLSAQATVSEPLFTNGQRASVVREAVDRNTADRVAVEGARRTMVQHVANAWNQMITARTEVGLDETASKAASDAFKGMQIEFKAGERSTLDVLLAEQTMRNAEIALLAARRDEYVGAATVLRYIGRLDAARLVADLPRYDPATHLRQVKNRFMAPWTGLVQGLDGALSPGERPGPVPRPPAAANPQIAAPTAPVPADAPLATALPTAPAAAVRK